MFYDGLVPNPNPSNNTKITFIKKRKIFKPIITGYNIKGRHRASKNTFKDVNSLCRIISKLIKVFIKVFF